MSSSRGEMSGGEREDGGRKIGEVLEARRRERGLTLKEVEEATKIRTRYLEGLEREDYSLLPDAVYVRGFLKTYADYLGLDGEALARELRERRAPRRERQMGGYERPRASEFDRPLLQPGGLEGTRRRRISGATIATIVVVLILLAVVLGVLYRVGQDPSGSGIPDQPREAPAQEAAASREPTVNERSAPARTEPSGSAKNGGGSTAGTAASTASRPERLRAVVSVTDEGPAWISVSTDGRIVYEGIAPVGFRRTFTAREVFGITTYNAAGVRLEINGQRVGTLGQYGEYVEREFPLQQPVQ